MTSPSLVPSSMDWHHSFFDDKPFAPRQVVSESFISQEFLWKTLFGKVCPWGFLTTLMGVSKGASCAIFWQALTAQKTVLLGSFNKFSREPKMSHLKRCWRMPVAPSRSTPVTKTFEFNAWSDNGHGLKCLMDSVDRAISIAASFFDHFPFFVQVPLDWVGSTLFESFGHFSQTVRHWKVSVPW